MNKRWWIALAYIAFIYSTLSVVVGPLRFLRENGVLRLSLSISYFLCFTILLRWMVATGTRDWWRYAVLVGVFALYGVIGRQVPRPEEQIHFFEYGLVSVLFARALEKNGASEWGVFGGAWVLAGLVGWLDEILQGHIPHRHYGVRDIFLNIISAALGLVIYAAFTRPIRAVNQNARIRNSSIQQ